MIRWGSRLLMGPVAWREPLELWTALGWLAAVAWPPIVGTLFIFPPTEEAGGLLNDWRLKALVAAGIAVAAIIWIVKGERERDGNPSTRMGVLSRFLLFGFIFSLAALIILVLGASFMTVFASEGFLSTLGEIESTLFLFGVAGLPFALMIGVSYALWAGAMVALISFAPPEAAGRRPRARKPQRAPVVFESPSVDPGADTLPPAPTPAPPPAPTPTPAPRAFGRSEGPHPETDMERALRPGWEDRPA